MLAATAIATMQKNAATRVKRPHGDERAADQFLRAIARRACKAGAGNA